MVSKRTARTAGLDQELGTGTVAEVLTRRGPEARRIEFINLFPAPWRGIAIVSWVRTHRVSVGVRSSL